MAVAGYAGADHVIPDVPSTAVSRHYVVQSKLSTLLPAILTHIVVTIEHLHPGEPPLRLWPSDELNQADD